MEQGNISQVPGTTTPAGANPFVGTFETGKHYQVHKSYVWAAPIIAAAAVVGVGFLNGFQGLVQLFFAVRNGELAVNPLLVIAVAVGALALLNALLVGLYALAWRNMSYVFDVREFSYYSGIITKRRMHVPYARVQSVNQKASIIQRLLGVCTVMIDSAGGAANRGVRVPYLQLETAERFRAELFMRKAACAAERENEVVFGGDGSVAAQGAFADGVPVQPGSAPVSVGGAAEAQPNALDAVAGFAGDFRGAFGGAAAFGEEPASYEFGLSNHELLLTTVSHDAPIAAALITVFTLIISTAFILLAGDVVASFIALAAVPIIIGISLFAWAIGLLSTLLSYGKFRARRRGSRIEVERGLLTRISSGIDIDRVQSIEVRQSFIRRIIGYCEISLGRVNAANEQNKGNNNSSVQAKGLVIHPFVKIDRVDEILEGLAPELAGRPKRSDCKPLPKAALRRAVLRRCVWYNFALWATACIGVTWTVLHVLAHTGGIQFNDSVSLDQYSQFMVGSLAAVIALCAFITVLNGISAVLWARHSGYEWNRRYLLLHNDGLTTAECIIPRQKIQSGNTRSNPFQRRLSLVTLQATTAAGPSSTTVQLLDIPNEEGAAYLDWLS